MFVVEPYNGSLPRLRYNPNSWTKVTIVIHAPSSFYLSPSILLLIYIYVTSFTGKQCYLPPKYSPHKKNICAVRIALLNIQDTCHEHA